MATLWVREFRRLAYSNEMRLSVDAESGVVPVVQEPGTDQTPVTFSTTAQSAAFAAGTSYIRVISDTAFHYVVGANPTATTNHMKCPAETMLEMGVSPGDKIAAVAAA